MYFFKFCYTIPRSHQRVPSFRRTIKWGMLLNIHNYIKQHFFPYFVLCYSRVIVIPCGEDAFRLFLRSLKMLIHWFIDFPTLLKISTCCCRNKTPIYTHTHTHQGHGCIQPFVVLFTGASREVRSNLSEFSHLKSRRWMWTREKFVERILYNITREIHLRDSV